MTLPQTAGDRNPTQNFILTLTRKQRRDYFEASAERRYAQDAQFHARVQAHKDLTFNYWISMEAASVVMHVDDIALGRWEDDQLVSSALAAERG